MRALEQRAAAAAAQARRARVHDLRERLQQELPTARVEETAAGLEVSGDGLLRRWLEDASIRFVTRRRR